MKLTMVNKQWLHLLICIVIDTMGVFRRFAGWFKQPEMNFLLLKNLNCRKIRPNSMQKSPEFCLWVRL